MTRFQRRFFLLFFVLLFFVTVPVVILTTKGYRFDWKKGIFIYSGSITLKSWPQKIDIYLDGKKQNKKKLNPLNNSVTLNGLRPGRHTLRCTKPGYHSWEKSFNVHSGISTEFWNIILTPLKAKISPIPNTDNLNQFFLSPRNKNELIYFQTKNNAEHNQKITVNLANTKEKIFKEIFSSTEFFFLDPQEKENVEWSNDHSRLLIPLKKNNQKRYLVGQLENNQLQKIITVKDLFNDYSFKENLSLNKNKPPSALSQKNNFEAQKVRWMFNRNDELVVLTKAHELFYVNIKRPEEKIILAQNVAGFDFAGDRIYYAQLPNNLVWEIRNHDPATKKQITASGFHDEQNSFLEMTVFDQYRISLLTKKNDLYVYNEEKSKETKSFTKTPSVKGFQFSDDGKKLLFWTNHEIWTLFLREWNVQPIRHKNNRILITRLTSPISNVQWVENYENILFSTNQILKIAELDNRDKINIFDVLTVKNSFSDRDVLYDKDTQLIYFRSKNNEKYQLWSSRLINKSNFLGF